MHQVKNICISKVKMPTNVIICCLIEGQLKVSFATHQNAPRWLLKHILCPCAHAHTLTRDIETFI